MRIPRVLQPYALTTRGTVAVRASGYLHGDRVPVSIQGSTIWGTVVHVDCRRIEVKPDLDIVDTWITEARGD